MSVSLCVLRIEIDEDIPEMENNPTETESAKEQKKKDRGARESKTIVVETYASVLSGPNTEKGILPTSSQKSGIDKKSKKSADDGETIGFFCGNPLVEVTKGVLHLYKENELKEDSEAKTLCLLSVPGSLGASDLLAFAAACQQDIAHVRVLRDGSPDHYMALLTFRTSAAAREFHTAFDGAPYSSLEPGALCHTAWVSRVEWAAGGEAPPAHTELPTCPVCLERMDESVAGVLSVQCAHAFHAECLARWASARCPVCRCTQTPEPRERATCLHCDSDAAGDNDGDESRDNISGVAEGLPDSVEPSSLWICLICGHVGCGRYEKGHAAKHFLASNHTYALQLGSNRVWDYAGDKWVHRLVQNKADGKLVAAEGAAGADKQLEFTYLLTQQLDAQRAHYDDRIAMIISERSAECEALLERATAAESEVATLRRRITALENDNKALDKRQQQLNAKVATLQSALSEERGLGAALANNHKQWQKSAQKREEALTKEMSELREQLRDVMFFVEARGQLEQAAPAAELETASVTVQPPPKPRRRRAKKI
ncbi:BRCA1-associated protein [Aricia agestis]|uniref:BRCA1-associated protein n=1 Tax=Aricia agestis TaxID=91739 RepID=UPI001C20BFC5|nr:BRCA1-associated protein [Aricia agestis]